MNNRVRANFTRAPFLKDAGFPDPMQFKKRIMESLGKNVRAILKKHQNQDPESATAARGAEEGTKVMVEELASYLYDSSVQQSEQHRLAIYLALGLNDGNVDADVRDEFIKNTTEFLTTELFHGPSFEGYALALANRIWAEENYERMKANIPKLQDQLSRQKMHEEIVRDEYIKLQNKKREWEKLSKLSASQQDLHQLHSEGEPTQEELEKEIKEKEEDLKRLKTTKEDLTEQQLEHQMEVIRRKTIKKTEGMEAYFERRFFGGK